MTDPHVAGESAWDGTHLVGRVRIPSLAYCYRRWNEYAWEEEDERTADEKRGDFELVVDDTPDATLTEKQRDALRWLQKNEKLVGDALLTAALAAYREWARELWQEECDDPDMLAKVDTLVGIGETILLQSVYVRPDEGDDVALLGYAFGSNWSEEHGFGVILANDRIVTWHDAETAWREID